MNYIESRDVNILAKISKIFAEREKLPFCKALDFLFKQTSPSSIAALPGNLLQVICDSPAAKKRGNQIFLCYLVKQYYASLFSRWEQNTLDYTAHLQKFSILAPFSKQFDFLPDLMHTCDENHLLRFLEPIFERIEAAFGCENYFYDERIFCFSQGMWRSVCDIKTIEIKIKVIELFYKYKLPLCVKGNVCTYLGGPRSGNPMILPEFPMLLEFLAFPPISNAPMENKEFAGTSLGHTLVHCSRRYKWGCLEKYKLLLSKLKRVVPEELALTLRYLLSDPGRRKLVPTLLQCDAIKQTLATPFSHTIFHQLVDLNLPEFGTTFLQLGLKADCTDRKKTPLHYALFHKNAEMARLFLPLVPKDRINDGWLHPNDGLTILHFLVKLKNVELLRYFFDLFPNALDIPVFPGNETCLIFTVRAGWHEGTQILLDSGASIMVSNLCKKGSAMDLAKWYGHEEVLQVLKKFNNTQRAMALALRNARNK